jgi:DNA-binding transcriptional ArsR family regulator
MTLTCDHAVTYCARAVDEVFRALADPTRRALLDELFKADGQSLSALERRLPLTRFGVMKHLKVLEEAGLVTTRRRGREKLHFLNAVPIRLVHDRWVSKYAEPWAAALTGLKRALEEDGMEKVFEIYIKTTPERLWEAITDSKMRRRYTFGVGIASDWTPGSRYEAAHPAGPTPISEGENLEVDPPRRLVQSFRALWSDDVRSEGTSRVTYEIEPVGDSCRLTVTHDGLREGANAELYGGWPMVLSGLKTLLETGEDLTTPGSLMYAGGPEPAA